MHAVEIQGTGDVRLREIDAPAPDKGEALISIARSGICGSDLHTVTRGHPWFEFPIRPGHEASGVVLEIGCGDSAIAVGDRVCVQPILGCASCFYCVQGRENLCTDMTVITGQYPGLMREHAVVPIRCLWTLPQGVSFEVGALVEPLATAIHAIRIAGDVAGARALVIGGGTIGQCMLLALTEAGVTEVVVSEPSLPKRHLIEELGAAATVPGTSDAGQQELITALLGRRPDFVFDCVAHPQTINDSIQLVAKGGHVIIVGAGHGSVNLEIPPIQEAEVRISGSSMYVTADFEVARDVARSLPQFERLVTGIFPMREAARAFGEAATGAHVKVQLSGPADPSV